MAKQYDEVALELDNLQQFFAVPDPDPFDPQVRYASGLETLVDELKPKALTKDVRTAITLPPDQLEPEAEQKLREAVERFCRHKIQQNQRELSSLRWEGFKALQDGVLFLGACLLLSTLFENVEFVPEFLRRFLGEGFLIAGWVSLWHPIEVLLYEWWPYSRENRIY